jgi:hypothetical protein
VHRFFRVRWSGVCFGGGGLQLGGADYFAEKTGWDCGGEDGAVTVALDLEAIKKGLHIGVGTSGSYGILSGVKKVHEGRDFVGQGLRVVLGAGEGFRAQVQCR